MINGDYQVMFKGRELSVEVNKGEITAYDYDDNLEIWIKLDLEDWEEQFIYEAIQEQISQKDFDKLIGSWYGISNSSNIIVSYFKLKEKLC